jgi:two-component system cell cycle sensor histidine kinase/response regulator CckA
MTKPVVLIVEDDFITRLVFKKLIDRLNYASFEAVNGEVGLDMIANHNEITHVFLDLNMPILDGYGFLHYLNSSARFKHLNIFITSVSDEQEFLSMIGQKNIDISNVKGYNKKPFDMTQLARNLGMPEPLPS